MVYFVVFRIYLVTIVQVIAACRLASERERTEDDFVTPLSHSHSHSHSHSRGGAGAGAGAGAGGGGGGEKPQGPTESERAHASQKEAQECLVHLHFCGFTCTR